MTVKQFLIINHTHTDFGFTDYPDTLLRHHNAIIDEAIERCEAEAHRGEASRFRWTCEVAYITANWFRQASEAQKDRFRALQQQGLMGVAAMPVHWTPLISPANAIRALKNVHYLRNEGVETRVAMQCDVNGLGWYWTDLLLDMGVDSFLLQPNPHRGIPATEMLRAFNWQSPSGRDLFTVHGWHYSQGVNTFFLGDDDIGRTQSTMNRVLGDLDRRGGWPYDTAILPVTNIAAVDNGFPTPICDFIERWNAEGRTPRLSYATIDQAMDGQRKAVAADAAPLPRHHGDWSDYWVDGVGSTAYETVLARAAERLLPVVDLLQAANRTGDSSLIDKAADEIQLYDEHTWGAFCSVTNPDSPFTRIGLNWKTARAHNGFSLALETMRKEAQTRARAVADGRIEGDYRLRRIDRVGDKPVPANASGANGKPINGLPLTPEDQSYYVLNPSASARHIRWPVVHDHAGSSPQTILDAYVTDRYLPGMTVRGSDQPSPTHVIDVELPAFGEAVVKATPLPADRGFAHGPGWIESRAYKLVVDPADGSIKSLRDKASGRECASPANPMGRLVYETLQRPGRQRLETFGGGFDWSRLETIVWPKHVDYAQRSADRVTIEAARQTSMGIEIAVSLAWSHGDVATITYRLPDAGPGIEVDALIHKQPIETPEAFYMLFGVPGGDPAIRLDVGDRLIDPARDQMPNSCEAWIAIHNFASVATAEAALVVASPDIPVVQPFGIQTGNAGSGRAGNAPSLAFWVLNNHWDVNFAAAQAGRIPVRFRLLPQARPDAAAARAFAEAANVPPVIVRAYESPEKPAAALLAVEATGELGVRLRKAWDADGSVVTLVNPSGEAREASLALPQDAIGAAEIVGTLEAPIGAPLAVEAGAVRVSVPAGGTRHVRLRR